MKTKIFIDPGHGGRDPGAMGYGLKEKAVTLSIALKIRNILNDEYEGHSIKLSRTTDQTLSLKQRTEMANRWQADYLLSVHINAGGGTGYEDYIYQTLANSTQTSQLRSIMHAEVMKSTGGVNRGKKKANFHMLRESKMSAILTENGFIDRQSDAAKLKTEAHLNKIARGHVNGLVKAFKLKRKASAKPHPNTGTFYRVIAGSFSERTNANKRVAALKKAGFDSFVDVYKK